MTAAPEPYDDDEPLEAEVVPLHPAEVERYDDDRAGVIDPVACPDPVAALTDEDVEWFEQQGVPRSALARRVDEVAQRPLVPTRDQARASAHWWARNVGRATLWGLTHPHHLLSTELRHAGRGLAVCWRAWRAWATEREFASHVGETPSGAPGKTAAAKDLARMRAGHRRVSFGVALVLTAAGTVAFFLWPTYLLASGIVVVALLDIVGRRNPPEDAAVTVVRRHLLEEGAPLGALSSQIIERLNEDGVRADPASAMTVHAGGEYRLRIVHEDAVEPKHLRSLERHLAARPMSLRLVGTADAGVSELRLPTRDHLARVPQRAWAPTGSRSIADPADLWVRSDGDPSAPVLAGVHIDLVGTTGAGKTEALQEFISHFGECRDVYPVFGDLTMGPVGPLNRRVLRKVAYTVEDLEALLDWVKAQVDERHMILHRLAESDDDDAPVEWSLDWGPQIELILDEYSFIAAHEHLHTKLEEIMRIGRKVKVCVIRASQRSGNKDLGSTVAQSLVGLKVLMACTERDTTSMLSTTHRDRGWTPHEFRPAVPGDARDAGKCFVWGPAHRDPEIHRFHAPLEPGEVKRRDRQREADGLPNLDGTPVGEEPAVLLSPVQVAVEAIFTERGEPWLPTSVLLEALAERGHAVTDKQLGAELAGCSTRAEWSGRLRRGYALTDIRVKAFGLPE